MSTTVPLCIFPDQDQENPKGTQRRACYKENKIIDNRDTRLCDRVRWVTTQFDSALLLHSIQTERGTSLTDLCVYQQHMVIHIIIPDDRDSGEL
jgi:hypothetical protein